MSKLEVRKAELEQQEDEYKSLVKEALESLCCAVINNRHSVLTDKMLADTLKRLTTNKVLVKGAKVLEAKKKFNEEKTWQVPTIYPKPLMDAVERGEIENVTKYPYFKEYGVKFRVTSSKSKSIFIYWSEKEGLWSSYELTHYQKTKAPLEVFNRIKKEMES